MHLLVGLLLTALSQFSGGQASTANTTCKDGQGNDVDWFFIYKFPESSGGGTKFVYLDSRSARSKYWSISSQLITDADNPVARSIAPLYASERPGRFAYVLYNDEPARSNISAYRSSGHTKGLILFDGSNGLWLVHSVPKFPEGAAYGRYSYPHSGQEFGQNFLCVTYPTSQLDTIATHLRLQAPDVYDGYASPSMLKQHTGLYALLHNHFIRSPPWVLTATLTDVLGVPFLSYAKNGRFNKDVYSEVVARNLGSDLYVSTWLNGPGGRLPSECNEQYKVMNVKWMKFPLGKGQSISFSNRDDHSKWAVSTARTIVCIGSLNRMHSQFRRGGETVCFKNDKLHALLLSSIRAYEKCPNMQMRP
ncbi:deoxyribonuclease-2-alpha-like [Ornithodoros turicata]|uniref:deoxyribonuclease-2-alpha-like n=1 Tax=Ornithodoros turicata TaxID=34597 RepID=UPI0031395D6F